MYHYAECRIYFIVMLNVVMLSVIMPSVVRLIVVAPQYHLLTTSKHHKFFIGRLK